MKLLILSSMAALFLMSSAAAQADEPLDGKTIYRTRTCMACHGPKGARPIQSYPAIAGQNEKYVLQQILDIKSGKRVGSMDETSHPRTQGMADILHILSDDEIKSVAKYVSGQEPGKPKPVDPPPTAGDIAAGQAAFKKLGCVSCHGTDGKKASSPAYPVIAGLHRDYLVRQMTEMRDGQRTNGQTKMMLNFIKKADDAAVLSIANYLSQVERPAK
jgi:cytochrome c553